MEFELETHTGQLCWE